MSVQGTLTSNTGSDTQGRRLESWKEIAAYLGRDVTTVRRWEKREGLPVHRPQHNKLGSIYAYTREIEVWREERARTVGADAEEERHAPESVERGNHVRRVAALGLLVLALTAGAIWIVRDRTTVQPASANGGIRSLAVLPLENFSGNPEQDYLSDGMTEALISRLSTIHSLRVISRTSSMHFKGTRESVPSIGKELNVDALIEGSVVRSGDKIRISVQLIRADTDEHFWAETYDRELGDALVLQSEVAQAIARRVQAAVTGVERARLVAARQVSPEAYESYLKGESIQGDIPADVEKSIAYFEDAIKKDPTFAQAYVGLANAYDALGTAGVGGAPPNQVRPKVTSAARKALELDPTLPGAHNLLAESYQEEWKWGEAESEYKRTLELNPNDAGAHVGYARWLLCHGRTEEAQAWARRARELDPLGVTGHVMGWILFHSRRYDEAIRELRSDVSVHPNDASAYWFLGYALIANGQADEAIPVLEKAVALSGRSPAEIALLIRAYAHAGRRAEALRLLEELKQRQRKGYVTAAAFVNAYLGLGDNEQALAWLEQAYKEQSTILQWIKVHPHFDPLRGDPRFADLVHRVGLD